MNLTNNDITEIFADHPEFEAMAKRQLRLEKLEQEIEAETNLDEKLFKYDLYVCLTRSLFRMVNSAIFKHLDETMRIIDEAYKATTTDTVLKERQQNKELLDNLLMILLVSPREGFEALLKHIEREKKIDDLTGQGWKWTLYFPLAARLNMAWKLVFGKRQVS